jgi:hypothetical protein
MTQASARRRGRPATQINPCIVGALAWRGLMLADIACALGVSRQCLHSRMRQDVELKEAYSIGHDDWRRRAMADASDLIEATALVRGALKGARTTAVA